jgi:protein gp37
MGENSAIEWTDHTFNPWWGCAKVSPACDHCYAATLAHRVYPGTDLWQPAGPRRTFGAAHWNEPLKWNAKAGAAGVKQRVFCASMADVFDNNAPPGARPRLWELIRHTPHLYWLLLTKRIGNVRSMLPADWGNGYANVGIGITAVNQKELDRDVPKILDIPAAMWFVSIEPMLGPLDLFRYMSPLIVRPPLIDWVIAGGESGVHARPVAASWLRALRDQCQADGVPFFFKQWGEWAPPQQFLLADKHVTWPTRSVDGEYMLRAGKKQTGRSLDGETHSQFPTFRVVTPWQATANSSGPATT